MGSEDTKERIIQAADRLFWSSNYQDVTMRDIADECGLSLGNITYHFPKKSQLVAAVYRRVLQRHLEELPALAADEKIHPASAIMAAEFRFMLWALETPARTKSFLAMLATSETCNVFIDNGSMLFEEYQVFPDVPRIDIVMANRVMFGGLRETLGFYLDRKQEYELDSLIRYPFKARLDLMGVFDNDELISVGIREGHKLFDSTEES